MGRWATSTVGGEVARRRHRPPQVLLLDRQPLFVAALSALLAGSPLQARVTPAYSVADALKAAGRTGFDLMLCEVAADATGWQDLLTQLRREQPSVPVVLLSDRDDQDVLAALEGPARGVFDKATPEPELMQGLAEVLDGRVVVGKSLLAGFVRAISESSPRGLTSLTSDLSPEQIQVLALLVQGATIRQIADSTVLPEAAVRGHLAAIYRLAAGGAKRPAGGRPPRGAGHGRG